MADSEEGANLERVTDFVDEDQISQVAPKEQLAEALSGLEGSREKRVDRVAPKVKLNSQNVALIMRELEVSKEMSEVALRESGGNVVGALKSIVWNH